MMGKLVRIIAIITLNNLSTKNNGAYIIDIR